MRQKCVIHVKEPSQECEENANCGHFSNNTVAAAIETM
jgi:hypothetical protein